jgi:hypothetical protein
MCPLRVKLMDIKTNGAGISHFILAIGLLDFNAVFNSDHITFFFDIDAAGFFGTLVEALAEQCFRKLQLEDPRIGQAYRKVLHNKSTHHNVYKMIKSLYPRSESLEWSLLDECKYEGLNSDVNIAMHHTYSQCLLHQKHTEPWSPPSREPRMSFTIGI